MFSLQSPPYSDSTAELLECTGINNHPIGLVDKPPPYDLSSHPLVLYYCSSARKTIKPLWLGLGGQERPVMVPAEYSDHTNVSSPISTAVLPKHTGINDHPINLVDDF